MAVWISEWIWRFFPDSMGGLISTVWLVLFGILRLVALRRTEDGSSPYRGLLCSAAAFSGAFALVAAAVALFGLLHIQGVGLLLVLLFLPISVFGALFSNLLYRGARGDFTPPAESNHPRSVAPEGADRKDAA
jgi:hypothetical protein